MKLKNKLNKIKDFSGIFAEAIKKSFEFEKFISMFSKQFENQIRNQKKEFDVIFNYGLNENDLAEAKKMSQDTNYNYRESLIIIGKQKYKINNIFIL